MRLGGEAMGCEMGALLLQFCSSCGSSPFSQFSFLEFLRLPRRGCLARNSAIFYANSDAFVRICVHSLEFSVNSTELSAYPCL